MAEGVAGITVPEGSPDALRAAAGAWAAVADALDGQAARIDAASGAVVGADWSGDASLAYAATSQLVSMHYTDAAGACRDAQAACQTFASELEEAKQKARQAIRHAEDAIDRRDRALARAAQARDDLREAQSDGREAEQDARRAARQAGHAFGAVAGAAHAPPVAPVAPVPVSLRGERPSLAALNPVFGGVFRAPGRFGSPAQARAVQIAHEQALARDAAATNKGTILDGASAYAHGMSFGLLDLGGDKNSDRYRGGDLASMIPITPWGGIRTGERLLVREAVQEGGSAAQRAAERKVWTRTVSFQGHRVYERSDLIDPLKKGPDGKTNLERMRKGNAPLGPDGKEIQLHHTTQRNDSALAEIPGSWHNNPEISRVLHINQPPENFPSLIDRQYFNNWRRRYWRDRALEFIAP